MEWKMGEGLKCKKEEKEGHGNEKRRLCVSHTLPTPLFLGGSWQPPNVASCAQLRRWVPPITATHTTWIPLPTSTIIVLHQSISPLSPPPLLPFFILF